MICYNYHTDFTLRVKSSPEMPPRDESFTLRVSCVAEHYDYHSDEVGFTGDCYEIPCSAEDFSSPGELTVAWEDSEGTMHPAILVVGRAFVGEPRELKQEQDNVLTKELQAQIDIMSGQIDALSSSLEDKTEQVDALTARVGELSTELAGRMTGEEWLDAADHGLIVRDFIEKNIRRDHISSLDHDGLKVYSIYGWTNTAVADLYDHPYAKPWILPTVRLPEPAEGEEYTLAYIFSGCRHLLHIAPMEVPGPALARVFQNCTELKKAPRWDTSRVTNFDGSFFNCGIEEYPSHWDFSHGVDLHSLFQEAKRITEIPDAEFPEATTLSQFCWSNPALRRIGVIKAPKNKSLYMNGEGFPNLEYVGELDYSILNPDDAHSGHMTQFDLRSQTHVPKLRYMRIINLGMSALSHYWLVARNWGEGSEENRQSLVDTLLTCSFDRAAAGMPVGTIHLASQTIARLTDEEKAAITAKGYTITTQTS